MKTKKIILAFLAFHLFVGAQSAAVSVLPDTEYKPLTMEDFLEADFPVIEPKVVVQTEIVVEYSIYNYIIDQCKLLGINSDFAMSILRSENCQAKPNPPPNQNSNGTQDLGMWQLNSRYLDWFVSRYWHHQEVFNVNNPFHNTYVALRIIQSLYKQVRHGNGISPGLCPIEYPNTEWLVAASYNAGVGTVLNGRTPQSSIRYANNVTNNDGFASHFMASLYQTTIPIVITV